MRNKKGQTLVEVVVALGILAVVFAGTVTLIVQVVNLELSARNRTEAVALAQKKLSERIVDVEGGCNTNTIADDSGTEGDYDYTVTSNPTPDYGNGLDSTNFLEVSVEVTWSDKGLSDETYSIKQIVRAE